MLEKNANLIYFDAHFHYEPCISSDSYIKSSEITGCSCAHSIKEWEIQSKVSENIIHSFGMHPQNNYMEEQYNFLVNLSETKQISAIGEMGFDFFTDEYKKNRDVQEMMFNLQLELAEKNNLPVVIHCRKANEKLFQYSSRLKKLEGVLFHSFMGPSSEAFSLLSKGINGYFSFGKQLMNNNKKAIECAKELPIKNLLLETDAPFQTLKNQDKTYSNEIIDVYKQCFSLRNEKSFEDFCKILGDNFRNLYKL